MISVFAATVLSFSGLAVASPEASGPPSPPIITELPKFSENPDGIGVGFAVGEPTGIAAAYRPHERHTIAGVIGWGIRMSSLHVHADYLATVARIQPPESILSVDVYAGAGPTINLMDASQPGLGVRVPLGVSLAFQKPVDVFMEVAPVIGLVPSTSLWLNGTMGVRTWFRSSKGNG